MFTCVLGVGSSKGSIHNPFEVMWLEAESLLLSAPCAASVGEEEVAHAAVGRRGRHVRGGTTGAPPRAQPCQPPEEVAWTTTHGIQCTQRTQQPAIAHTVATSIPVPMLSAGM